MIELILPFYALLFGLLSYQVAKIKGRNPVKWFLFGFLTGFLAVLVLFILPKTDDHLEYSDQLAAIGIGRVGEIRVKKQTVLHESAQSELGKQELRQQISNDNGEKLFEDDFVTCPNCRIVNPIENEKCSVCGMAIVQK